MPPPIGLVAAGISIDRRSTISMLFDSPALKGSFSNNGHFHIDPAGSRTITLVMIESNLVEGNQKLTRGQSVTDACINWDATAETLEVLAGAVRKRRNR